MWLPSRRLPPSQGTVKWNDQTIELRHEVNEQLRHNNRVAMGLHLTPQQQVSRTPQQPQSSHRYSKGDNPLSKRGGSTDANREWEISSGMNVYEIDNEETQRAKWRR